jgi:hypothetical protein
MEPVPRSLGARGNIPLWGDRGSAPIGKMPLRWPMGELGRVVGGIQAVQCRSAARANSAGVQCRSAGPGRQGSVAVREPVQSSEEVQLHCTALRHSCPAARVSCTSRSNPVSMMRNARPSQRANGNQHNNRRGKKLAAKQTQWRGGS